MEEQISEGTPVPPYKFRWVGFLLLLAIAAAAAVIISRHPEKYEQEKVMLWWAYWIALPILTALWWLFFSGVPWSVRWRGLGGAFVLLVLTGIFVKLDGTTGDLRPRLAWRFSAPRQLPSLNAASTPPLNARPAGAADSLQFLGSQRNSHVSGAGLGSDWAKFPPELLWKIAVGEGWSGFAVSGSLAITQEQRDGEELVVCYDLLSGKPVWSHADTTRYDDPLGGVGPRATPTIVGQSVVTMGATGVLNVLELATGKLQWSKNVLQVENGSLPEWGVACSPLVLGDAIIVAAGNPHDAMLVSYLLATGEKKWASGTQKASYSSPTLATILGKQMLLYFGPKEITGLDPTTGKTLWSHPFMPKMAFPHVALPVVTPEGDIIVSSGYGKGSMKIRLSLKGETWSVEELWQTNRMKAKFTNLIELQNHLYGLDDGIFACLDHQEGKLVWRDGKYLHGQSLLLEPDRILVTAEGGYVALISPSTEGLKEISRFQALDPAEKAWNPPTLAGRYLLVRNNKEAACFRLP